jgi:hypothetical protein
MDLKYAREKLGAAVECLVGSESLRERLWQAFLECHVLQTQHLGAELGKRWNKVRESLNTIRALDENSGRVQATLTFSAVKYLAGIAREILEIYGEVVEAVERRRRGRGDVGE